MKSRFSSILFSAAVALTGSLAHSDSPPPALPYPAAPRGNVIDDYHGTKVADAYRWLEDLDAPTTRAWVTAENAITDGYVAALPLRKALQARIGQLYNFERFGLPFHGGTQYFYQQNTGLQNQSVLYAAEGLGGRAHVVLDTNTLSKDGSLVVVGYVPSRDGRLIAYGVSVSGSDWREWRIRDVASGRDLPDVIRNTKVLRAGIFARRHATLLQCLSGTRGRHGTQRAGSRQRRIRPYFRNAHIRGSQAAGIAGS